MKCGSAHLRDCHLSTHTDTQTHTHTLGNMKKCIYIFWSGKRGNGYKMKRYEMKWARPWSMADCCGNYEKSKWMAGKKSISRRIIIHRERDREEGYLVVVDSLSTKEGNSDKRYLPDKVPWSMMATRVTRQLLSLPSNQLEIFAMKPCENYQRYPRQMSQLNHPFKFASSFKRCSASTLNITQDW